MEQTLERILAELDKYAEALDENERRTDLIKNKLKNEKLSDDEEKELQSELETLYHEADECLKDIAMLEEVLDKMDLEEREERYDSWDEVFTGGDY